MIREKSKRKFEDIVRDVALYSLPGERDSTMQQGYLARRVLHQII